jgi:hypothetical protein
MNFDSLSRKPSTFVRDTRSYQARSRAAADAQRINSIWGRYSTVLSSALRGEYSRAVPQQPEPRTVR